MEAEYITYGIVDNGIMILGAMTGYNLEKYLPKKLQNGLVIKIANSKKTNSK